MAKGKLILICQCGGEFVTNDDGTMSYNGGEANAANVTSETPFNDLKLQLAETCNLDQKTVTIKYFLPGNKKNLIVVKNDKDIKRMIDFHGDAITAEVFVMGTPGFDHNALKMQPNEKDETLNHDVHEKKDETQKRGRGDKVPKSPPGKQTRCATKVDGVSDDMSDDATSAGSTSETSSSNSSERDSEKADSSSDYKPKRSRKQNSRSEIDVDADTSPADAVKKRRRTPSWKFGVDGRPTIISSPDNNIVGSKSQGKSGKAKKYGRKSLQRKSSRLAAKGETKPGRKRSTVPVDDSDQQLTASDSEENLRLTIVDDYALPETMVDSWKTAITGVGQEFGSVNEFRSALKKYAIANRFGYRFKKNDTSRAIGGCAAEGCTWKFYAVWVPTTQSFVIKTLDNVHTCDKECRKSAHPAKNWLVGTIKDRLRESPYLKPKEIANGLLQDFGVELNYTQVWRGIGDAREQLHGSPKESYNKLPWFCEKLVETNPGSVANLVIGDKKRFKSLFVSFYALIYGFQNSCRPLIFLEAASLKSRYGEILLTANAIDGNDNFFSVAFAIVDAEDDSNWQWFLEQLKTSISNSRSITFVVDRDKKLQKTVLAVFENAHVGYSIYHLLTSFKRNMKGPFHGDGKAFLAVHFLAAAHAARLLGFKKSTEQIKLISSQAYDWVMQIEPEHWATSFFKGERYNYITEDVGESYAKLMEDYRHLPILQKIDALIRTMIDDMEDARLDSSMWSTQLTASKERELEEEKVKACGLKVLISSDTLFEVREDATHVVNISNWSCTCRGWKETGLPCRHALAVFSSTGKNPYDFCSSYFTTDNYRSTYAESIHPIPIDGPNTTLFEKQEGEKAETENKETVKKEGELEGTKIEDGEKMEVQQDESLEEENEKENDSNITAEKERTKLDAEKDEGGNVNAEKDEGDIDTKKDEGGNMDSKKDEGGNVEAEKQEGSKVDVEKDDEGKIIRVKEDDEDPNVFVLPPIPTKPSSNTVKKEMDGVETEGEIKRRVTCSKCKQPGHYKKSCKIIS